MGAIEFVRRRFFSQGNAADISSERAQLGSEPDASDAHMSALLRLHGCPVCNDIGEFERRHFFWFLYESYQESSVLSRVAEGRCFCPEHGAYLARGEHSAGSLAYVHSFAIAHLLRQLDQFDRETKAKKREGLLQSAACHACLSRDDHIRVLDYFLARFLSNAPAAPFYPNPGILCVPHLIRIASERRLQRLGDVAAQHQNALKIAQKRLANCEEPHAEELGEALQLAVGHDLRLARSSFGVLADDGAEDHPDSILRLRANLGRADECPICREMRRARREWLDWLADGSKREDITDVLPTCAAHVWEAATNGSRRLARLVALNSLAQATDTLHRYAVHSASPRRCRLDGFFPKSLLCSIRRAAGWLPPNRRYRIRANVRYAVALRWRRIAASRSCRRLWNRRDSSPSMKPVMGSASGTS
jgi:hypothetical protein